MSGFKVPLRGVIDELPLTATGKVKKKELLGSLPREAKITR